jgi:hypothetical protein
MGASFQTADLGKRSVVLQPTRDRGDDLPGRTLVLVAEISPTPRTARPHGLDAVTGTKPRPDPPDPPMVPFALAGIAAFAVAGLIVLVAGGPAEWRWVCLAGFLLGIPGLLTMLRHDANRRRRRALSHPDFEVHDSGT